MTGKLSCLNKYWFFLKNDLLLIFMFINFEQQ